MFDFDTILNSPKDLVIVKAKCENSLEYFTRFFFRYLNNRKYIVADYNKEIINSLEQTYLAEITRLIINIPPRHGKTELAKSYIARGLAFNPSAKFLYISFSDSLAEEVSVGVKDIVTSPIYQRLWGLELRQDTKAKKKWYTKQGGGVVAVPIGGQITGHGAGLVDLDGEEINIKDFGGAIFIDDPIKPDDARNSPTIRQRVNEKYINTISNRTNSKRTPIILIMQRLHPQDLSGFLLDGGSGEQWELLKIPILINNKPIAPHIKDLPAVMAWKRANDEDFETQGMQNPVAAKGLSFPTTELNFYENLPSDEPFDIYAFVDYANAGNDYYSMSVGYIYLNPVRVFIHDTLHTQKDNETTKVLAANMLSKHKISLAAIEINAEGALGFATLKEAAKQQNLPCQVFPVRAKSNMKKEERIAQQREWIRNFFYFKKNTTYEFGSDYFNFMQQVTEHKKAGGNTHDDAPDSLAGLAKTIRFKLHSELKENL